MNGRNLTELRKLFEDAIQLGRYQDLVAERRDEIVASYNTAFSQRRKLFARAEGEIPFEVDWASIAKKDPTVVLLLNAYGQKDFMPYRDLARRFTVRVYATNRMMDCPFS